MDIIFRLNFSATLYNSGNLAIVPSSFIISTITPAGLNPASLAKSIAASVCPVLLKTPPSLAIRGKMWPGFDMSWGLVFLSIRAWIVLDLSDADIPVVTPLPIRSTDTVKAVSIGSVLLPTIGFNFNSLDLLSVIGTQISPLPCIAIKFTISGVIVSAAAKKSPSFSLFSSSTTIMTLPERISLIADSILSNCLLFSLDIIYKFL